MPAARPWGSGSPDGGRRRRMVAVEGVRRRGVQPSRRDGWHGPFGKLLQLSCAPVSLPAKSGGLHTGQGRVGRLPPPTGRMPIAGAE